jgi:hypothetical protein
MIMWTCYQVCFHGPLLSDVIGKAEEYIYETDCDSYAVVTYSRAMSATDAG